MKYTLILLLFAISIKSQLSLNISASDVENNNKLILIEIYNSSNSVYSIPIDTTDFQSICHSNMSVDFKPVVRIMYKKRSLTPKIGLLELNETELDNINENENIPPKENKTEILKIKPKETLRISIIFNPFQFNVAKRKYSYYDILDKNNYTLTINIQGFNDETGIIRNDDNSINFKGSLISNPISVSWNLKNRKYLKW